MNVDARLGDTASNVQQRRLKSYDESVGRPAHTRGNGMTYRSNGYTMNSRGYLANPSRQAQINARNAGALTNSEARSMGLRNYRDEGQDEHQVGNVRVAKWLIMNELKNPRPAYDEDDESVGWRSASEHKANRDMINEY